GQIQRIRANSIIIDRIDFVYNSQRELQMQIRRDINEFIQPLLDYIQIIHNFVNNSTLLNIIRARLRSYRMHLIRGFQDAQEVLPEDNNLIEVDNLLIRPDNYPIKFPNYKLDGTRIHMSGGFTIELFPSNIKTLFESTDKKDVNRFIRLKYYKELQ